MFGKGLYRNGDKSVQPTGTYRYALNAVLQSKDGDDVLTNEDGYAEFAEIQDSFIPIGKININNGRVVLFLVDPSGTNLISNSQIAVVNTNGSIDIVAGLNSAHAAFNFSINNKIKGQYVVNKNNEVIIYWVEDNNPPRFYNIDNPPNPFILQDTSLFPLSDIPYISLNQVSDTGGSLLTGNYQFSIQLFDKYFNATNFIAFSEPIFVTKTNFGDGYDANEGADGGLNTTKSININIEGLRDTSLAYYSIGIVKTIGGIKSYIKSNLISLPVLFTTPTNNNIFSFTYSNDNNFLNSTESEITNENISYSNAKTITQLNNKLLLGNLQQQSDIGYQTLANQITVKYSTEEFMLEDLNDSYKNPRNAAYKKSLMRDEVYALAIVWLFNDDTESFAYHIPGRTKITGTGYEFDGTDDYTYDEALGYVDDVYPTGTAVWKVVNTAQEENRNSDLSSNGSLNNLGYYESPSEVYPNIPDFVGLVGTPVRHHKMPSLFKSPSFRDDITNNIRIGRKLLLNFTNIQLPTQQLDRIKGFKIVRVSRNNNKSVLAQGLLFNYAWTPAATGSGILPNGAINSFPYAGQTQVYNQILDVDYDYSTLRLIQNQHSFYSPDKPYTIPDYFETEGIATGSTTSSPSNMSVRWFGGSGSYPSYIKTLETWARVTDIVRDTANIYRHNSINYKRRPIDAIVNIPNNDSGYKQVGAIKVYNFQSTSHIGIEHTGAALEYANDFVENTAVDGITRTGRHFVMKLGTTTVYYDTYNSSNNNPGGHGQGGLIQYGTGERGYAMWLVNMKKLWGQGQYEGLTTLEYEDAGYTYLFPDTSTPFVSTNNYSGINNYDYTMNHKAYAGDVFICDYWFKRCIHDGIMQVNYSGSGRYVYTQSTNPGGSQWQESRAIVCITLESETNVAMRYSGLNENPYYSDATYTRDYAPHTDVAIILDAQDNYIDNFLVINTDYNTVNDTKVYPAKPLNLSPSFYFPTRVVYSQTKNNEETADSYRIFKANDYLDLPKNKGELVDLVVKDGKLIAHTKDTMFVVASDEQRLETTDATTVNITSGNFLSNTPQEVVNVDAGYAGLFSKWGNLLTPYGYIFVDSARGKVFLFNDKLNDISAGLSSDFKDTLKFQFIEDLDYIRSKSGLGDIDYPFESPSAQYGIGYSMGFDKKLNRFILYKKDFNLDRSIFINVLTDLPIVTDTNAFTGYYQVNYPTISASQFLYLNGKFYQWANLPQSSPVLTDLNFCLYNTTTHTGTVIYPFEVLFLSNFMTDNSFTLSYCFNTKNWVSYHSARPILMYETDDLYNIIDNGVNGGVNTIFKSHSDITTGYGASLGYGYYTASQDAPYPFEVEIPLVTMQRIPNTTELVPDNTQKQYKGFTLKTKCTNELSKIQYAETFDEALVLNNYQCSDWFTLVNRRTMRFVRGLFQINKFRDLVVNHAQPFVDSNTEPISSNINANKNWTLKSRLTDTYINIKLKFWNSQNKKLSLYDIEPIFNKVLR